MNKLQGFLPATSSGQKFTFKIIFSYFFDYAVIAVLAVIYGVLDKILTPFAQHFSMNNITLMNPIADPERVPIAMAMVYSCLCPAFIIAIYTLFIDGMFSKSKGNVSRGQRYTWGDRLWELNCGVLGLFLAQGTAFVITGSLKNLIGKPRPDLLARCLLNDTITADPGPPLYGLLSRANCTSDNAYILQDGFRSFPSGHSSSSFAGLFYLSLYLAAKLHVLDQRGEVWRTFIVLIPTLAASMIAGSRIIDARHHPFDVLFGSALGLLCGWGSYRQYFPPVTDTWEKGRAYPMRSWGVPLRRPDGTIGTDGQFYGHHGRIDRTTSAMVEDEEDRQALVGGGGGLGMEPIRSEQGYSSASAKAPPFQQFQQRGPSPMVRSVSEEDETDYEHVRVGAGNVNTMPTGELSRNQSPTAPGGSNAFREQLNRNQSSRGGVGAVGSEEQDLAYQRPVRHGVGKDLQDHTYFSVNVQADSSISYDPLYSDYSKLQAAASEFEESEGPLVALIGRSFAFEKIPVETLNQIGAAALAENRPDQAHIEYLYESSFYPNYPTPQYTPQQYNTT
ncbi:hypothetical protein LTR24_000901 [Lithohypha guttulata]|uniref:Phosphatidic acid phosphatase type 2/haloperoxidase domain-containing protein n=1 Tax=Lithohypha guttulata TaxID=1690604 RepID=A0ABR0KME8_9EURO|nr:hypothetical protein LTR24_000901 [Lithohypha guttulata]